MVDLVCLRSFAHVCEMGTIAGAAEELGYTAPAVSQQLAKLERDLDLALFDRVAGRLKPTEHGTALLAIAADMLDLAERCRHLGTGAERVEPVTIAAFASAITEIVAPALGRLAGQPVVVRGVDDKAALRELRLGIADVAIVQEYDHRALGRDDRLVYNELATDELRLVLPPTWSASTTLHDVDEIPWLSNGDGTHCTSSILRILDAAGMSPTIAASIDDNRALLRLVSAGHGVCIVPALVLNSCADPVTVASQSLGASRTILAVTRRSSADHCGDVVAILRSAVSTCPG